MAALRRWPERCNPSDDCLRREGSAARKLRLKQEEQHVSPHMQVEVDEAVEQEPGQRDNGADMNPA